MDTDCHRLLTGLPNDLILNNARVVADSGTPMLCRLPLIANVNDTTDNIIETARFIKSLGNGIAIELLPYHRLGIGKYQTLDKPYPGETSTAPSPEQMRRIRDMFEDHGVRCIADE